MATYFPRFIPAPIQRFWGAPPPMAPPMRPQPHPLDQQRPKDEGPFIPPDYGSIILDEDEDDAKIEAKLKARAAAREPEKKDEEEEEDSDDMYIDSPTVEDIPRGPAMMHMNMQHQQPYQSQQPQRSAYPQALVPLRVYKFRPSKGAWKHITLSGAPPSTPASEAPRMRPREPCSQIRIVTWNIDMGSPRHAERLDRALRHLEEDVLGCKDGEEPPPCVLLLQEVSHLVVPHLLEDPWVRRWFAVTPFSAEKWPPGASYGTVTLVARMLDIHDAHILYYGDSGMHRTALCVKVCLNFAGSHEKAVLAIVNTHLESLPSGAAKRPHQLQLCSRFLRLKGVDGGIIAGDMNTIVPVDAAMSRGLGLRDCWRKSDDDDRGKTWGYQGQTEGGRFPPNRLDRILYLPGRDYKLEEPRTIGVGLKVGEGQDALWVSDHYGLVTTLRMKGRSQSS